MKKLFKFIFKLLFGIITAVLILVLVVIAGLNVAKFGIYSDYYKLSERECTNPGLNEGFVTQGVAVDVERNLYLTSGYMADDSASRIYITNRENKDRYVELYKDGEPFTGHAGGLSLANDMVYIASDDRIFPIELDKILNSVKVDIGEGVKVNNQASFTFANDEYLYVGEFHHGPYVCEHPFGEYNAICTVYKLSDLTTPVKIYSIRDKVQGFCVTDEGKIVLSTSWSVANSYFYIYDESSLEKIGDLDGAPVYAVVNEEKTIKAPAMAEDLSYSNGKVYTAFESACNKYIFGKLFFAYGFMSLDI